ncbi:MAG: hypothetical protein ACLP2Y_08940 [Limisphaerales bacterium]
MIRSNPNAYTLAAVIAYRARWSEGFNADGVGLGEAMIGDFASYGMTRQEYRTALAQLIKWRFATTRATNDGTIARLMDKRLFEIVTLTATTRATNGQPPSNHRATTNYNGRTVEQYKGGHSPRLEKLAGWQLRKDLRESTDPAEREAIKAEMQRRKGQPVKPKTPASKPKPAPAANQKQITQSPEMAAKVRDMFRQALAATPP